MAMFFSIYPFRKAPICQGTGIPAQDDTILCDDATVARERLPLEERLDRDIEEHRFMAALSYLGPLCLIPYLAARQSPFAHRHAVRGMNLLLVGCGYAFLSCLLERLCGLLAWQLGFAVSVICTLLGMFFPLLSILGIRAVLQGKICRLPIVGGIRIIKR